MSYDTFTFTQILYLSLHIWPLVHGVHHEA
jgi:hypothetical protein